MTQNTTPRERRLKKEYERMKELQTPNCLFTFLCANLEDSEAEDWLHTTIEGNLDSARQYRKNFLTPEEFDRRYPDLAPEKYLIVYTCRGLKYENKKLEYTTHHEMEVVFGLDYLSAPPTFIWWTPIWHPNFRLPYVCIYGHPFSIGQRLDQIVPEIGRMVQYQSYNVKSTMNPDAGKWAELSPNQLPIDERDILDAGRSVKERRVPLIELFLPSEVAMSKPGQILELVENEAEQGTQMGKEG